MNVAFVKHLDDAIGRVLKGLKDSGFEENTVVAFTATMEDRCLMPRTMIFGATENKALRWGAPSAIHYAMARQIPAGSRSIMRDSTLIFSPLFSNWRTTRSGELDAVSLVQSYGEKPFQLRETCISCDAKEVPRMVARAMKRLSERLEADAKYPYSPMELYNLKKDPQETTNVLSTNKQKAMELSTALRRHIQRGGATPGNGVIQIASAVAVV